MTPSKIEVTPEMVACSDDIANAISPLLLKHDARLIFASIMAEAAYVAAMLRASNVYKVETITRVMSEALITALTIEIKQPKVLYTDGEQTGTKQ